MMPLVRLNDVAIKGGGFVIAAALAEIDEALIAHERDAFARELSGRHARGGALKLTQVLEQLRVATLPRIDPVSINTERFESFADQPIVLGFIAGLSGERELHIELGGCSHPYRRQLACFELVLECDAKKAVDRQLFGRLAGSA